MIAKSALLTDILKKADDLSKRDGKASPSVDYVMIVLLDELNGFRRGAPAEHAEELMALEKLLAPYSLDLDGVSAQMKEFVRGEKGTGYLDFVGYGKMTIGAEATAIREGKEVMGADICLKVLLESPTAAISRFILHKREVPAPAVQTPIAAPPAVPVAEPPAAPVAGSSPAPVVETPAAPAQPTEQPAAQPTEQPAAQPTEQPAKSPISSILDTQHIDLGFLLGNKGRPQGEQDEQSEQSEQGEQSDRSDRAQPAPSEAEPADGMEAVSDIIKRTKRIQEALLARVYGQNHAIATFAAGYFRGELSALTLKDRTAPRATFLFAGPPGVGKTFLAEQASELLNLPVCRFDMSEYADRESEYTFCGTPRTFKYAEEGKATGFVRRHPRCVLIFDEVEKANLTVIQLFLQILDAGRLCDNYTKEEVSFRDAILIFTTNAGRKLYEDNAGTNLSVLPPKAVIKAIASEIDPTTGMPCFPAAICSRFAAGNVILFNSLGASDLIRIVEREFENQSRSFAEKTGVKVSIGEHVPYALMFSEGGNADARMIRGKSSGFIYRELYELYRLVASENGRYKPEDIREIAMKVELPADEKLRSLFLEDGEPDVLLFAEGHIAELCKAHCGNANLHVVSDIEAAKDLFAKYDIRVILCDILCAPKSGRANVLNLEDTNSTGRDFFLYAVEYLNAPVYLLQERDGIISEEELLSFSRAGARGVLSLEGGEPFGETLRAVCGAARQQKNLFELARANKVVNFCTAQRIEADGRAEISLYDLQMAVAVDAEDKNSILSGVSKPDVKFGDVIGAQDAKEELGFFVDILKNPAKYMRKGIKTPKGALLYGPPGTGKTLLAKAMAGESGVTFIAAEGNQFLKKYVGEGPASVHALFATARKYAPSILFVDEIDAIAKPRGTSEAEHTADILTSFLTEMDGFRSDPGKPVFVLAATNCSIEPPAQGIDPALLRRFDRKILVDLPSRAERTEFLRLKMRQNPTLALSEEELDNIASRSTGMSLADFTLVLDLALRSAFRTEAGTVTDEVLEHAFETYVSGEEKKWDENLLRRTAYHEAGHALICYLGGETPSYLTIVARASHGGYMQHAENETKALYTREELLARIRTALGGRAAEMEVFGDNDGVSTGASGDLVTATRLAEEMICTYGMDGLGLAATDLAELKRTSYFEVVRRRVNAILNEQFERTREALSDHRHALEALTDELIAKNHLKGNEIEEILRDLIPQ